MNKSELRIHFYGRYYLADIKCVYDILKKTYSTTYDFHNDTERMPGFTKPSAVDFILTENTRPSYCSGKRIDVGHGLNPALGFGSTECKNLSKLLMNEFDVICLYGQLQKEALILTGYPQDKIVVFGMPYSIDLLKPTDENHRKDFLLSKGLDPDKKTLLYAPTWNQSVQGHFLKRIFCKSKPTRQFFESWWEDGKERQRVEKLCNFIQENGLNFMIRMHEKHRYDKDWLGLYSDIFDKYGVFRHYLNEDADSFPYLKYSDVLLGDISGMNTYFYVMDKPVIHLNKGIPFGYKVKYRVGAMDINDRAGYVAGKFDEMLEYISDSFENPGKFSEKRETTVKKYIDYVGDECALAIYREFRRIFMA